MNLLYKTERPLFVITLVVSLLFWLLLIVGTIGIALIYVVIGFIAYLFVQSAFISWLRGNGVRVTSQQFPKLYAQVEYCCRKLEISPRPEVYLVNSHGVLNALATKFLGDHFIVLYSEVVEALEDRPEALNFYIGHELGHIKRNDLTWGPVLWPGMLLPHLGTAYSRAREYTCDLYGLACCATLEDAQRALAVLVSGDGLWKQLDIDQYQLQAAQSGGFWMSFHEYTADYPWLVKRVEHVRAVHGQRPRTLPRRSVFAFLLACFVPRLGTGAGGGMGALIVIAMVAILAAVAIPAYQDYQARANGLPLMDEYSDAQPYNEYAEQDYTPNDDAAAEYGSSPEFVMQAIAETADARAHMLDYFETTGEWPESLEQAGYSGATASETIADMYIDADKDLLVIFASSPLEGSTIYFTPQFDDDGGITMACMPFEIDPAFLPPSCQ